MAPPRTDREPITLRLDQHILDAIDTQRRRDPDLPSRPEVIRQILENWYLAQAAKS
jgi:Arc/MetJ-type ribon-helix-helix transcriptional regulator